MMKTDIQIAQEAHMRPIAEVAKSVGISEDDLALYGKYKAKVDHRLLKKMEATPDAKVILVTAISPTPAGEGKTTTTVGLGDALKSLGKKALICLREPSLGPVFGVKGGAAGGGYAQVVPMEDINLHFTGDLHAIGAANNLLAAMIDNHIFQVSCSDFDGNVDLFEKKVDQFLLKAQTAPEKGEELRLAFIGVPPICPDIYNYLESIGARVVFNEVQRQFAMPNEVADIVTQYQLYTYPYGVFGRLEDIQEEIDKRNIDGVIHYVQSFCYRQIEDMIFREKLNVPLLTIEGDKPGKIDARTKLRIDSFVEMLK